MTPSIYPLRPIPRPPHSLAHGRYGYREPRGSGFPTPLLSSSETLIVPDNDEEIYGIVEELSQIANICLCITSPYLPPMFQLDAPRQSTQTRNEGE
jgi:hypothetical protein